MTTSSSTAPSDRALVIIPTYNEADNIVDVLELVMRQPEHFHALGGDDGSPDGTADRVRTVQQRYPDRIELIERSGKLGLGSAYIRGFRHALARGFTYVCEMPSTPW